MRERFTGHKSGWIPRGGAILGLFVLSLGCSQRADQTNIPAPPMPEALLLKVTASCSGPVPVVGIIGWAEKQKPGPETNLLVVEKGRDFRVLDNWVSDGLKGEYGEYMERTYPESAPEQARYRDFPVPPLQWRPGQYKISVINSTIGIKENRRYIVFGQKLHSRLIQIPNCPEKPSRQRH